MDRANPVTAQEYAELKRGLDRCIDLLDQLFGEILEFKTNGLQEAVEEAHIRRQQILDIIDEALPLNLESGSMSPPPQLTLGQMDSPPRLHRKRTRVMGGRRTRKGRK